MILIIFCILAVYSPHMKKKKRSVHSFNFFYHVIHNVTVCNAHATFWEKAISSLQWTRCFPIVKYDSKILQNFEWVQKVLSLAFWKAGSKSKVYQYTPPPPWSKRFKLVINYTLRIDSSLLHINILRKRIKQWSNLKRFQNTTKSMGPRTRGILH